MAQSYRCSNCGKVYIQKIEPKVNYDLKCPICDGILIKFTIKVTHEQKDLNTRNLFYY